MFPATPYDAKGMLNLALRGSDPVIFFESQRLYDIGEQFVASGVPEGYYEVAEGEPSIKRQGKDFTIITIGATLYTALAAADLLKDKYGLQAEIIDLRFINPLKYDIILESVKKTGKVVLASDACERGSFLHTVASNISQLAFDSLDAPPAVVGSRNWITPAAELESLFFPQKEWIVDTIHERLFPLPGHKATTLQTAGEMLGGIAWECRVEEPIGALNSPYRVERFAALREIARRIADGQETTQPTDEVNNHVHTTYSFSPYSPAMVAYRAWKAGLRAVGCMDHDSVSGAEEMIEACKIVGIASTVGCEIRVSFSGTAVEGRTLNNPDSANIVYIALHGIPHNKLPEVDSFLRPVREARNERNRRQVERLNALLPAYGLDPIDFERDVYPRSCAAEGGSITERHLLAALAAKIMEKTGKGSPVAGFLADAVGLELPATIRGYLRDGNNPHYLYDLLGVLKSSFLPRFYIQPDERECASVYAAVDFANGIGAIPAYAYLGDVTDSPTGDKRPAQFEDSFLDLLVPELKRIGFKAITYMPPRNTLEQLKRVQGLCAEHGLMEISGVDINSSRQSFTCPEILTPDFSHLIQTTWALIAHEHLATADPRWGLFAADNPLLSEFGTALGANPLGRPFTLTDRLLTYSYLGAQIDAHHPERLIELVDPSKMHWEVLWKKPQP